VSDQPYRVRVLVADEHPGLIPFTFDLHAENRDEAIKIVRRHVRERSGDKQVVKHIDTARRTWTGRRGNLRDPYDNDRVH
jgi:hypothetical protein